MGIKPTKDQVRMSIVAVEQYIALKYENAERHQANVLVHARGKDFCPGVRMIFVKAENGSAEVIIEKLETIYADCSNCFTTQNSIFSCTDRGLRIETADVFAHPIIIYVSLPQF